jgi:lysophospholipid acyltransferase (LPLAT)-like uncharacterized protein
MRIKDILKKIEKSNFVIYLIVRLLIIYTKLVTLTAKITYNDPKNILDVKHAEGKKYIFTFWHGRSILLPEIFKSFPKNNHNIFVIASIHKSGDIIKGISENNGAKIIRGSSHKGGLHVVREVLKSLKNPNNHLCISPDGPRGPNMKINGAVLEFAKRTGAEIIPISYSSKKAKFSKTWDHYFIPKFFDDITIEIGKTYKLAKNSSDDQIKSAHDALETELNKITHNVDAKYSHPKITPGEIKLKRDKDA